jgi:hypothetical protein
MSSGISNLKPKGECECKVGCGKFSTLGKPDREGRRHARLCPCPSCRGRRSKRTGQQGQAKAAKALGIPTGGSLRPGHEEHFSGLVRTEIKAGKQANPVLTRYRLSEAQSEVQRPIGDNRPFVAVFEPEGVSYGLVVIRTDKLTEAVAALAEQLGMTA